MKKALFILASLVLGAQAYAQDIWEFGIKGGIALNMMPGTTCNDGDIFKANLGFQGGAFTAVHISDVVIAQLEAQYSRKGVYTINHATTLVGGNSFEFRRNIHYLQFPLMIGLSSFANGNLRVMIGPELGVYLGDKITSSIWEAAFDNEFYNINPLNLAIALQATWFFTNSLGLEIKGDFGVTDTFKKETEDKGKNTALQIGLCWRFAY